MSSAGIRCNDPVTLWLGHFVNYFDAYLEQCSIYLSIMSSNTYFFFAHKNRKCIIVQKPFLVNGVWNGAMPPGKHSLIKAVEQCPGRQTGRRLKVGAGEYILQGWYINTTVVFFFFVSRQSTWHRKKTHTYELHGPLVFSDLISNSELECAVSRGERLTVSRSWLPRWFGWYCLASTKMSLGPKRSKQHCFVMCNKNMSERPAGCDI